MLEIAASALICIGGLAVLFWLVRLVVMATCTVPVNPDPASMAELCANHGRQPATNIAELPTLEIEVATSRLLAGG